MFSRAASAGVALVVPAAKAASFGNPDEPPQGAINAKGPGNLSDPGPQNPSWAASFLPHNPVPRPMSAACR
jgi:oxalate decarboxylase